MSELFTPRQVAEAFRVSESSVKRWCDDGRMTGHRTPGGHRRIELPEILRFVRDQKMTLARPEALGLPTGRTGPAAAREEAFQKMEAALLEGDEETYLRVGLGLVLEGLPLGMVLDRALGQAFKNVGQAWEHGKIEIYQERRAVQIATQFTHRVRMLLPCRGPSDPVALGGSLTGDHYSLPTSAVELVLLDAGWNAQSCGTNLPGPTLARAIEETRPRLVWLSVSWIDSFSGLALDLEAIEKAAGKVGASLVWGGFALTPAIAEQFPAFRPLGSLEELARQFESAA